MSCYRITHHLITALRQMETIIPDCVALGLLHGKVGDRTAKIHRLPSKHLESGYSISCKIWVDIPPILTVAVDELIQFVPPSHDGALAGSTFNDVQSKHISTAIERKIPHFFYICIQ